MTQPYQKKNRNTYTETETERETKFEKLWRKVFCNKTCSSVETIFAHGSTTTPTMIGSGRRRRCRFRPNRSGNSRTSTSTSHRLVITATPAPGTRIMPTIHRQRSLHTHHSPRRDRHATILLHRCECHSPSLRATNTSPKKDTSNQKRKGKNARTHIHTETDNTLSGGKKTQNEIRGNRQHNQTNPTQQRGVASEPATESEAKGKRPGEVGERRRGVVGWGVIGMLSRSSREQQRAQAGSWVYIYGYKSERGASVASAIERGMQQKPQFYYYLLYLCAFFLTC